MLGRISSKELTEWMAFSRIEPFGSDARYLGFAIVAATMANIHRGKNKAPYEVADFMPKFREVEESQSVEAAMQFVEVMTAALGGKDLREKDD